MIYTLNGALQLTPLSPANIFSHPASYFAAICPSAVREEDPNKETLVFLLPKETQKEKEKQCPKKKIKSNQRWF